VATEVKFLLTRRALLREPRAFFVALAFLLLLAPISLSLVFLVFVSSLSREISSSPFWVWVWACDAALISVKRPARVSRAALTMRLSPLSRQILSRTSSRECAAIPLRLAIRCCRWRIFLSLTFPDSGSAIFLAWEKAPFPFATLRWLILPSEWRWTLRLASERLDVF
jgi:hypothetical protein